MEWGLDSCVKAFEERRLRAWIEEFLVVPEWRNEGLLKRVQDFSVYWPAPVLVPLGEFARIAGPGPEFKFPQDPNEWSAKIDEIVQRQPRPEDLPPVIAWRDPDGSINLADGNHRVDALKKMGYTSAWALIHDGPLRSEAELAKQSETATELRPISQDLSEIAERFRIFATECEGSSEIYQFLATKIAEDEEILAIAKMSRDGQPEPNMLFGVVHLLLINGIASPLRRYYPSLALNFESAEFAFPLFKKFVLDHVDDIVPLLQEKLVQTNEVQRSAYLYPAILTTSQFFEARPVSLIELGSSAGFNLLWDQYQFQYDEEAPIGPSGSSLTITGTFKGEKRPNFALPGPTLSNRIGIDLHPIDVMNQDQITWLQALVWPEHFDRKSRLTKALRIALVNPLEMIEGDVITLLPSVLAKVPKSEVPVVYHTWVANQMSAEQQELLLQIIDDFGQKRDIVHIHTNIEPHLHATIYRKGERIDLPLANVDGHARWIEWLR